MEIYKNEEVTKTIVKFGRQVTVEESGDDVVIIRRVNDQIESISVSKRSELEKWVSAGCTTGRIKSK